MTRTLWPLWLLKYIETELLEIVWVTLKTGFFLIIFATVTAGAQEPPVATEPDAAQVQEAEEKPVEQDAKDKVPETFDPTEEISEDYSIDFPVNI